MPMQLKYRTPCHHVPDVLNSAKREGRSVFAVRQRWRVVPSSNLPAFMCSVSHLYDGGIYSASRSRVFAN